LTIERSLYYVHPILNVLIRPKEENMSLPTAEYRPRHPQDSDYYHCVEDYFEIFVQVYDDWFSRDYGFWRPYIEKVICVCPSERR
jgi:hypothetical protein